MKALFQGQEYNVIEDYSDGLILEPVEGDSDQQVSVPYSDPTLIVDPTDIELDAARAWRERMPRRGFSGKYLTIESSHGSLMVDRRDGVVVRELSRYDGEELMDIIRFDLDEWKHTYSKELPQSADILDFGYWMVGGTYEEPAHEWRKEREELREEDRGDLRDEGRSGGHGESYSERNA